MFSIGVVATSFCLIVASSSAVKAVPPTPEEAQRAADENRRREAEVMRHDTELREKYRAESLCLAGTDSALSAMEKVYAAFRQKNQAAPRYLDYTGGGDSAGIGQLISGSVDAAVVREPLTDTEKKDVAKAYPAGGQQLTESEWTSMALVLVTHKNNPVSGLTYKQLEDIYRGKVTKWADVSKREGDIVRIGTEYPMLSSGMFLRAVLKGQRVGDDHLPWREKGYSKEEFQEFEKQRQEKYKATGGKPFAMYPDDGKVLREVAGNPLAIGYCLFPSSRDLPKEVRAVPIVPPEGGDAVLPTRESILLGAYPLRVTLRLLVSPKASQVTKDFLSFAVSEEAGKILSTDCCMVPASEKGPLMQARRQAEAKAGKGVGIEATGAVRNLLMRDLASEYVKAKAVVQMRYAVADEAAAVGQFLSGKELLLLQGPPSEATLRTHGVKWAGLKAETYTFAALAGAIVVNASNKEGPMTVERVRAIFAGEVNQWGDGPPAAEREIRRYGLPAADPAAAMFLSDVMHGVRCRNLQAKKDTAEVFAAVALDPQGIAFVNVASMPPNDKGVRVVPLGPADKATMPDGKAMAEGIYPLSKPLLLYVSPRASDTAKDFAKFVTSGACASTLREYGLVPVHQTHLEPDKRDRESPQTRASE